MTEKSPVDEILSTLSELPFADKVFVFGSTARGAATPGDVDAVVDYRPLTRKKYLESDPGGKNLRSLLKIAYNRYGWFDPFLRFAGEDLLVRSDDSRTWMRAKNRRAMLASIDAEARTLQEVMAMRQRPTVSPSKQPYLSTGVEVAGLGRLEVVAPSELAPAKKSRGSIP